MWVCGKGHVAIQSICERACAGCVAWRAYAYACAHMCACACARAFVQFSRIVRMYVGNLVQKFINETCFDAAQNVNSFPVFLLG